MSEVSLDIKISKRVHALFLALLLLLSFLCVLVTFSYCDKMSAFKATKGRKTLLWLRIPEGEYTIMQGVGVWQRQEAERSHLQPQAQRRERKQEVG